MKPQVRKLVSRLLIFASILVVLAIAFSTNDLPNVWGTLFTLDPLWLLAALASWFGCLFFEGWSCWAYLRRQHYRVPFLRALYISTIGYYYANITPGASGGEPMQVYYMSKSAVPVGVATSCVIIKMVFNQLMLIVVGSLLWLCNRDFVGAQLGGVKWAIIIGWVVNFAMVPIVLLATFNRPLVQRLAGFLVKLGVKCRLIKSGDDAMTHVSNTLDTYHESILRLGRHPWHIVLQLLLAALSVGSLLCVPLCVYASFGAVTALESIPWYQLLTVSYLLFISASYTPLPGASGAQEGGFLVFFKGIFPSGVIGLALLVWRFFTFYMFLLVGMVCVVAENIRSNRRKQQREAAKPDES